MHRVNKGPQIAAKPVQLSNETDRDLKERLLNLLAQGQAITRTRPRNLLAVKNERLGEVLESLERTGQLGRTPEVGNVSSLLTEKGGPFRSPYEKGNGTVLEQ